MAVLTEKEKLQREIAKLSEKINRTAASNTSSSYPTNHQSRQRHTPYPTKWHAPVPNARASSKKVPGNRNRSLVLDNRIKNSSVPPTSSSTAPMTTQSSTPHAGSSTSTPALVSTSTTPITTPVLISAQPTPAKTADSLPKTTYVHHTTKKGNMSLVKPEIYGKFEKARLSRPVKPSSSKSANPSNAGYSGKRSYSSQSINASDGTKFVLGGKRGHPGKKTYSSQLSSANGGTSVAKRVVIDGVTYEFAEDGNLKRVEDAPSARQKKRKLDNREGSQTKKKGKRSIETHCRFFTKTGTCLRADRCPYIHDPHRIAICSRFLRNKCPLTAETCPVSHKPSPHNTPSCAHFQKNGFCRDDDACLYPHVKVADNAPVCVAFSTEGWCDKGAECQERHAWECREYSEKGTCSRGAKCGLAHILKAKMAQPTADTLSLSDSDILNSQHSLNTQQPDDVELPLPGIPPMPEKTIETEQQLAQNQVLHAGEQAIPSGNDFERQEDFIQFADLEDVDQDEDDEDAENASSEGDEEETGRSDEGDVSDDKIKYSFGDGSDEASGDDDDAAEELMVVD